MGTEMRNRRRMVLVGMCVLLLGACSTLKDPPPQPEVLSLPPAAEGGLARLGAQVAQSLEAGNSAFLALEGNREALLWRLAMAEAATTSIDAQYFIWTNDEAGNLLFASYLAAADRGVRVRLLVDDLGITSRSRDLAAVSQHPHFEIKIYNPGRVRESALGGVGEFIVRGSLNRRMHNKLMIVDGHAAIAGGRNIGNPYFGISDKFNFRDFDLIAVGSVVGEMALSFDEYWNSELAFPGAYMSDRATKEDLQRLRDRVAALLEDKPASLESFPIQGTVDELDLSDLPDRFKVGEAHFLQDDPVNVGGEPLRLLDMLDYVARETEDEWLIVSPYLLPTKALLELLTSSAAAGIKVKILTGSLGSNNHTSAHSHYKKYRRPLLASGAELFEFRHDPSPSVRAVADVPPVVSKFISLHTKVMVSDRTECFVGSLNLDPRAIVINTENGIFLDSPSFCGRLAEQIEELSSRENAWRVSLDEKGKIRWESREGIVHRQPARGFGQRIADFFFRLLPIESQI